jgi:3-oxoacyl-[acyl-carrier-protein] synthase II
MDGRKEMTMTFDVRKHRVFVTGAGVISPLGRTLQENLDSLRLGEDRVSEVTAFDISQTRCKTAGQIPISWLDSVVKRSRYAARLHRSSQMMIAALTETLRTAGEVKPEMMVVASSAGGMSHGELYYRSLQNSKNSNGYSRRHHAGLVASYMPQKPILDAQSALGIKVPFYLVSNACSSGSNAIGHAFELVRAGLRDRVVCGGYDALSELVFVGFDSLQAATPERIRPFDRDRSGLVLGEGAGLLFLESEKSAIQRKAAVLAEVVGYGVSTDTSHMTQPHPSGIGPRLAMSRALESSGLRPEQISYVNAHGTATVFNDATEGIAISELLNRVPVSSTKSMMGHALGGAGAIEAVFGILSLMHQFMPPNINFREPDPTWTFEVVANQSRSAKLDCLISNSFGFGGSNASLALQRV